MQHPLKKIRFYIALHLCLLFFSCEKKSVEDLIAESKILAEQGKNHEALTLAKGALQHLEIKNNNLLVEEVFEQLLKLSHEISDHNGTLKYANELLKITNLKKTKILAYKYLGHTEAACERFSESIKYYRTILALEPQDSNLTPSVLFWIAEADLSLGNNEEAIESYQRCLDLELENLGPNHINLSETYIGLGSAFYNLKNYNQALLNFSESLKILQYYMQQNDLIADEFYMLAANHFWVGESLFNLEDYKEALKSYKKCLEVELDLYGTNHINVSDTLTAIGNAHFNLENYDLALSNYEQSLEISSHEDSEKSSNRARDIADCYFELEDFEKSIYAHEQCLKFQLEYLEYDSPDIAITFRDIGYCYFNLEEYELASQYISDCLEIQLSTLDANDPLIAQTYESLCDAFFNLEDHETEENYLYQLLEKQKSIHGEVHKSIGDIYQNIAISLGNRGNHDGAVSFFYKALETYSKSSKGVTKDIAQTYKQLGKGYDFYGDDSEAFSHYQKSLSLYKKITGLGEEEDLAIIYDLIAESWFEQGNFKEALDSAILANKSHELFLKNQISTLSPKGKFTFVRNQWEYRDPYSVLATIGNAKEIANSVLRNKGLVMDLVIKEKIRYNKSNPNDKQSILDQTLKINYKNISQSLNKGEVLLEFVVYTDLELIGGELENEENYGAILISSDQDPSNESVKWIKLSSVEKVDGLLNTLLKKIRNSESGLKEILRELHDLLVYPICKTFDHPVETLLISPDGELSFLPFSILLDANNTFLCETITLFNISSGRDYLGQQTINKFNAALFGQPNFGDPLKKESDFLDTFAFLESSFFKYRNLSFHEIPQTEIEINLIRDVLEKYKYESKTFIYNKASEENLELLDSPTILHLATHGFFVEEDNIRNAPNDMAFFKKTLGQRTSSPMQRSGLALTGAKKTLEARSRGVFTNPQNDGILTAEEASQLDLSNTWLTVLSACDTGSGVARAGEGVLGLRRAFAMAGTQNLLLTLWPVDDTFTKDFMVSFYEEVLRTRNAPSTFAKIKRDWLVKLRKERSISQAVKLAGPFVLTFRGNPELN